MSVSEGVQVRHCINHPSVETVVSCGRCDRPLCPKCMIFTPVGVRCRDCAQLRKLPQYSLTGRTYLRVVPAAVVLVLILGYFLSLVPGAGLIGGIVAGLLAGEGLRRASGYKQGREMEIIAGVTVVLAVIAANLFYLLRMFGPENVGAAATHLLNLQFWGPSILGIIVGIVLAVQRLR